MAPSSDKAEGTPPNFRDTVLKTSRRKAGSGTDRIAQEAGIAESGKGTTTSPISELGQRLRLRRKVRRLTLSTVAEAAGISTAQLSLIERGNAMPSVDKLVLLSQALHMPLSWLLDPEGHAQDLAAKNPHILRKGEHRHISFPQNGIEKDMLTSDAMLKLQMMRIVLRPDGTTGTEPYNEPEGAKCGIVLRGRLGLQIDGTVSYLQDGDTFAFDATAMIRFWADGVETEVIWITTPAFY